LAGSSLFLQKSFSRLVDGSGRCRWVARRLLEIENIGAK
jgi:hypothetical protein